MTTHDHPVPEQLAAAHAPLADEAIGAALAGCATCQSVALTELARTVHIPQVAALTVSWATACMSVLAMATGTHGQRTLLLWRNTAAHQNGSSTEAVAAVAALKIVEASEPTPPDVVPPAPTWDTAATVAVLESMGSAGRSQVCHDALDGIAGSATLIGL